MRGARPVRQRFWIILAAAALAVAAAAAVRIPFLVVRDEDRNEAACFPLAGRQASFSIGYMHSVAKLPSEEFFTRGPGGSILLIKTVYKGLGAGLPFDSEGGRVSLQEGAIVIEGLKRSFESITVIPLPFTEHRLTIGGRSLDLMTLLGGHARAVLAIEPRSLPATALYSLKNLIGDCRGKRGTGSP